MSNLKKVLALVMAVAMVMTMFAGAASIKTVLDVKDADKFTAAQLDAAGVLQPLGVLKGYGAEELGAGKVKRAEMVAFIYRLLNGGDEGVQAYYTKSQIYKDVDPEAWYAPYLNWAKKAEIAVGYGETFAPEKEVSGAEAAAMLVRMLGKDAAGADFAQKAQYYATTLRLDEGIVTKGLYENALDRGDMFIFLKNTLFCQVKDNKTGAVTTIAQSRFDLEIIPGAILVATKSIGSNGYVLFSFRTSTEGDVQYFKSAVLSVEEGIDLVADMGCKYTLYVSKSQDAQGYRTLYAAYEEAQGKYYKVVEGTVDDGKLIFSGDKQNVKFDKDAVIYVDGKVADAAAFQAAYGKKNAAAYKLIDNDGDGLYEFAFIERLTLAKIATEKVNAKVTAIAANGDVTITAEDGTVYSGLKFGQYFDGKSAWVDVDKTAKPTLGIDQAPYTKYTGISDTYYAFDIVANADKTAGYIYGVGISEKTVFSGYGVFVAFNDWNNLYKNMPYATFVNEKNEYFKAYVQDINNAASYGWAWVRNEMDDGDMANWASISEWENRLVYFTDGDYSDGIVSFLTADYLNANQTYNYLDAAEWTKDYFYEGKTYTFKESVWSEISPKETFDYSTRAKYIRDRKLGDVNFPMEDNFSFYFGEGLKPKTGVYAVFEKPGTYKVWNGWYNMYYDIHVTYQVTKANNRLLNGLALTDYAELEGKFLYPIDEDSTFYRVEDLDACIGFIYLTDASIKVDYNGIEKAAKTFQIYKANGYWHLRYWSFLDEDDLDDVKLTFNFLGKDYPLQKRHGNWYIVLADGTDPETGIGHHAEEIRLAQLIKGFIDDEFTAEVEAWYDAQEDKLGLVESKYTLLNAEKAVIFAYGKVIPDAFALTGFEDQDGDSLYRWVAYDASTFNKDYSFNEIWNDAKIGYKGDDWFGWLRSCRDEMIYTVVGGKPVVKAMKITTKTNDLLPYGWITPAGYEVVVYNGMTGAVNTNGWEIDVLSLSAEGVKSYKAYTKIGLGKAEKGDILLVKKDETGAYVSIEVIGNVSNAYLTYAIGGLSLKNKGILRAADTLDGDDDNGNYYSYKFGGEGKTIIYFTLKDGKYTWYNSYDEKTMKGKDVNVYGAGNYFFVFIK